MTADRDATVDVVGDAEQVLSMVAHAGPNGAYATTTTDALLAINVNGGNADVARSAPSSGDRASAACR